METTVLMRRKLFDSEIKQDSKTGFLSANDLLNAGNLYRLQNKLPPFSYSSWISTNGTKEFIRELEGQFGTVIKSRRGKHGGTWMHPYLFIDLALAISPKLKIEVYRWLYDELLKYRNDSGDSYKRMAGAIWSRTSRKTSFARDISKLAKHIQHECGVKDWEIATEDQLRLRDRIHENIALLAEVMNNLNQAIRIAIIKAKDHV